MTAADSTALLCVDACLPSVCRSVCQQGLEVTCAVQSGKHATPQTLTVPAQASPEEARRMWMQSMGRLDGDPFSNMGHNLPLGPAAPPGPLAAPSVADLRCALRQHLQQHWHEVDSCLCNSGLGCAHRPHWPT